MVILRRKFGSLVLAFLVFCNNGKMVVARNSFGSRGSLGCMREYARHVCYDPS